MAGARRAADAAAQEGRLIGSPRGQPPRGGLVALLAVCAAAVAFWLHVTLLERAPHVDDEATYLFQAESLLRGSLWGPASPFGVSVPFTLMDGERAAGVFPNGWPAVLALFMATGAPWGLVNPLLLGLLVWRGADLARQVGGASAMVPAALLLALSPQMLLLGGSGMSHTLVALCWVLSWELARRPVSPRVDLGLGVCLAVCFVTRPLCGAVLGLALLASGPRPLMRWLRVAGPVAIGVGLQLGQNAALTDDPLTFAVNRWFDLKHPEWPGSNQLGFGPNRGHSNGVEGHDLGKAVANTRQNLSSWNQLLLGPWLLVLPLVALWRKDTRRELMHWMGASALLIAAYALYWYSGTCYGARFYHGAAPLLLVASGVGLAAVPSRRARLLALGAVAVSQTLAFTRVLPELIDYRGVDARFLRLVEGWENPPAVVLVAETLAERPRIRTPLTGPRDIFFSPGVIPRIAPYAAPWPESAVWLAVGSDDNLARARQTGREIWLYQMGLRPADDRLVPVDGTPTGGTAP